MTDLDRAARDRLVEQYWLLHFEDADVTSQVFTDESAAKAAYERAKDNWTCTLFAPTEALDEARKHLADYMAAAEVEARAGDEARKEADELVEALEQARQERDEARQQVERLRAALEQAQDCLTDPMATHADGGARALVALDAALKG